MNADALGKALAELFVQVKDEMQDRARFRRALALYDDESISIEADVLVRGVVSDELASEELSRRTRPKPIGRFDGDGHQAVIADVEKLAAVA